MNGVSLETASSTCFRLTSRNPTFVICVDIRRSLHCWFGVREATVWCVASLPFSSFAPFIVRSQDGVSHSDSLPERADGMMSDACAPLLRPSENPGQGTRRFHTHIPYTMSLPTANAHRPIAIHEGQRGFRLLKGTSTRSSHSCVQGIVYSGRNIMISRPTRSLTRLVETNFGEYRCQSGQLYGKSDIVAHRATSYLPEPPGKDRNVWLSLGL